MPSNRRITRRPFPAFGSALLTLVLLTAPVVAHHANSAYDTTKTATVKGTVTKWQLISPHSGLWIEVRDDQGKVQVWSGEFGGALDLYRSFRWNKDTFKPGDLVSMTGNPARNGNTAMFARKITLPTGQEVDLAGT